MTWTAALLPPLSDGGRSDDVTNGTLGDGIALGTPTCAVVRSPLRTGSGLAPGPSLHACASMGGKRGIKAGRAGVATSRFCTPPGHVTPRPRRLEALR